MKVKINSILLFFILSIAVVITSCRSESDELIEASEEQSLKVNSKVANLMLRTTMNNGSSDDSIDNSSCFNIQFPFTIITDEQEIVLTSQEDIESIEDVFDDDEIAIRFPITIVFEDFSEVVVDNEDQFEELIENCEEEEDTGDDDDEHIKCIDFMYPFSASVFDAQSELITTIAFENDKDLHLFIDDLDSEDVTNINFPITVVLPESTEISISDLDNLEEVIDDAIDDDCDGDDDTTIDTNDFSEILTGETWEVLKYKDNQSNESKNYKDFVFDFSDDGTVIIENEDTRDITNGTWSLSSNTDGGSNVNFDFGDQAPLNKLNGEWKVKKARENQIQLDEREGDGVSKDQLFFKNK